eukprot:TRINITY_DN10596_c0_g1_i5.p1 TRINITY_DN10596_c0_g1~~TRINITY_DN10596_c0_g1_i5.p1  ORF type:complete len:430 (+),score=43.72 TRINITY_DN10596_c0_g1_i5:182-1471(+)
MTATEDEIAKLLSLLADNKSNSFNSTGAAFSSTFPSSRRFAAGQALAVLLQHADLLPVVEDRVNAIFILYFLRHREPPTNNPFLAIFDSIIKAPPSSASGSPPPVPYCLTPCEKAFATQLISGSNNELLKQSASSFCQAFNQSVQPPPARQELDSLLQAQATLDKPARYLSSMFHHPDRTTMAAQGPQTPQATAALVSEAQSMSDLSLSPGFVRVSPPVLPIASSETSWMVPRGTDARVRYNDTLGVDKPRARADDELRRIITHATQEVIPLERQQEIMAKLQADHQLVFRIGMTPEKLPGIVNKNPVLSVEILLRLMSSTQITDYFSMLVNMPLTLQCMEVVNKLTQTVELPSEFIHLYISNCISACEALEVKPACSYAVTKADRATVGQQIHAKPLGQASVCFLKQLDPEQDHQRQEFVYRSPSLLH